MKTCKAKLQYSFQPLTEKNVIIHRSKISVSSNKERY